MNTLSAKLVFLVYFLLATGCGAYVEKAKYDGVQKQLAETQEALRRAGEQVAQCQAHKYETFHSGSRTWRLDTVTGRSCILLTAESDWQRPKTTFDSCTCEDMRMRTGKDGKPLSKGVLRLLGCVEEDSEETGSK